jgi:hypothetical protein
MKKRKENGLENWVLSELWCDIVRKGGEIFKTDVPTGIITRLLVLKQGTMT